MDNIFIALIELRPLPGSALDPRTVAGAAVRCYIPAAKEEDARQRLAEALAADQYELREVEFCHPFDSQDWEQSDDGKDAEGAAEAKRNNRIAYGTFHIWGHDAPDAI